MSCIVSEQLQQAFFGHTEKTQGENPPKLKEKTQAKILTFLCEK